MAENKEKYIGNVPVKEDARTPLHLKLKDKSVKTKHLGDKSVTEEKLDDNSISTRTIQGKAVTESKLDDAAVSTRTLQSGAVTHDKLHNDAVESNNIKDGNIGWDKLDENLQNIITTASQHDLPLSTEFGDSDQLGITQKTLTESRDYLQNQIDAIIAGQTQVNLSANKNAVFVGSQSTVSLSATANTQASSIKIFKNGVTAPITTGSGTSLSYTDTVTPLTRSYIQYYSEFVVSGITKRYPTSGYINIQAVNPVYLGVGTTYSGASMSAETTPHAAGSFTRQLSTAAGNYLFIEVPDNFNLTAISLVSTYETNLGFTQIESTRAGYKAYKNNEPRGAGIYTYKFTIANA